MKKREKEAQQQVEPDLTEEIEDKNDSKEQLNQFNVQKKRVFKSKTFFLRTFYVFGKQLKINQLHFCITNQSIVRNQEIDNKTQGDEHGHARK